jgi:hypothetical protein
MQRVWVGGWVLVPAIALQNRVSDPGQNIHIECETTLHNEPKQSSFFNFSTTSSPVVVDVKGMVITNLKGREICKIWTSSLCDSVMFNARAIRSSLFRGH